MVAWNVMCLKGIEDGLGRLLTVSPRLKCRITVAEKTQFCRRIRNLLEESGLGLDG